MRPPVLVHVAWTLIAVVAFAIGTFVTGTSQPSSAVTPEKEELLVGTRPSVLTSTEKEFLPLGGKLASNTILLGEQARVRTFEILAEPNRIKRMRQLSELLEHVTKENWKAIIEAFLKQSIHEGRKHDEEWFLMLERIGEVAGREAVESELSSASSSRMPWLLIGWADSEPDQALEWLQAQTPETQARFFQSVIVGIAKADPRRALEITIQQPQELQEEAVGRIVGEAIQRGGFAKAEELLRPLVGRSDIEDGTRGKLFYNIARRRMNSVRLEGDPLKILDWFDGYLGEGSPAGGAATKDIISSTAAVNAEGTLQWLEERAGRFGDYKSTVAYPIVARALQSQMPEKFATWMDAHPDHPQYDAMVSGAVPALLQMQKLEDAKRLSATVRDEKVRAQLAKAVQQYETRNQQQQPR